MCPSAMTISSYPQEVDAKPHSAVPQLQMQWAYADLMVENAARQAQQQVCALAHIVAMAMGSPDAEVYAGHAIIARLS